MTGDGPLAFFKSNILRLEFVAFLTDFALVTTPKVDQKFSIQYWMKLLRDKIII